MTETPLTATVTTGEERNVCLARWEREGKIRSYTALDGWDGNVPIPKRLKTRHVDIWDRLDGRARHLVEKVTYDARQPYPDEITFTKIALAVMALT